MQFDDDFGVPFSALTQPVSLPLNQPQSLPTTMFDGGIPAVHFAPVEPIHFAAVSPLHGPEFVPIYHSGVVHAHTHFAPAHPVLGTHFDTRA